MAEKKTTWDITFMAKVLGGGSAPVLPVAASPPGAFWPGQPDGAAG